MIRRVTARRHHAHRDGGLNGKARIVTPREAAIQAVVSYTLEGVRPVLGAAL
jgi:hypothetical protein